MTILFLVLLLIASPAWGFNRAFLAESNPKIPISTITFWWTVESVDLGANDYTAGDNQATLNQATIGTGANKVGTNGLDCTDATDFAHFTVTDLISATAFSMAVWFRLDAAWTDGLQILGNYVDADNNFSLKTSGGDDLTFTWEDGASVETVSTTSAGLVYGSWYYAIIRADVTNDLMGLEVYDASGSVVQRVVDQSKSLGAITYNRFDVGNTTATDGAISIDQIVGISSSYSFPWRAVMFRTESPR